MKKLLTMTFFLLTMAFMAGAQSSIKVEAPNMVASDEQFNITFIIEGEDAPSDFSWNPGGDFQLVWGPQKGSSTSISVINGKRTKSSQTTYTYVLLPKKTGTFSIPGASASVKGKAIASGAVSIQVLSGGASSPQGGSSQQDAGSRQAAVTGDVDSGDLFLKLSVSNTNVVVGEPLNATLKLYQRVNISAFEDVKFPTFNGFWSQETLAPSNIEFHRENVGDQIYNAAVLRAWTLIPQQSGPLTIDPAELVCLVNVRVSSGGGSIFDSFFQDDFRTLRKRLTSSAVKVNVSSLPAGAPTSFGGGVGKFSMTSSLTRDVLKAHDAASLKVTVSGKGNVSLLEAPKVSFPPDFEVYDVKSFESSDKSSKTFEFPFIPRSHGDFVLGPVEYTYFDTASRKYVTLRSDPMPLKVEKGAATEPAANAGQVVTGVARKDVKDLASDIRYIFTGDPELSEEPHYFLGSALSVVLAVMYIIVGAVVWLLLRRYRSLRSDVRASRNKSATKMARKRLAKAGEYLGGNLGTAFYEELHRALLGFASDKLGLDSADLTKDSVKEKFCAGGVPEDVASRFVELIDACEYARYAPDSGQEAMNSHFEGAVDAISMIDSCMKKKNSVSPSASLLLLVLLLLPAGNAVAGDLPAEADSLWNAGCMAYSSGQWTDALASWEQLADLGLVSPKLYYNMGNACIKSGENARAVLYYERSLKMDPSSADARYNLEYAGGLIQDRIDVVPEFFLRGWIRTFCWKLKADTWGLLAHVFLALAVALVLLFLLGRTRTGRKLGFFFAIASLLLSLACLELGKWQIKESGRDDAAIVMRPVTSVKSSPADDVSKDLFILHEGTKVHILDTVGEWCNIELADGRQGWLRSPDIEII